MQAVPVLAGGLIQQGRGIATHSEQTHAALGHVQDLQGAGHVAQQQRHVLHMRDITSLHDQGAQAQVQGPLHDGIHSIIGKAVVHVDEVEPRHPRVLAGGAEEQQVQELGVEPQPWCPLHTNSHLRLPHGLQDAHHLRQVLAGDLPQATHGQAHLTDGARGVLVDGGQPSRAQRAAVGQADRDGALQFFPSNKSPRVNEG